MKYLITLLAVFTLASCCEILPDDECGYQISERTVTAPLTFSYEVNTRDGFTESHVVTASDILDAIEEPIDEGTIKKIEIQGAVIEYTRIGDNTAATLDVEFTVVDRTARQTLVDKSEKLPLYDVPFVLNINDKLNRDGIKAVKKLLRDHVDRINNSGMSVQLEGVGFPSGTLAHFSLDMVMTVTVVYEVCDWLPLSMGGEECEG